MNYSCKILLDSISETGKRLTTFEITFPRIVLAEFNTHRMFSRNSASSRAIPFSKMLERVQNDPFIPEEFPVNSKGMQPQTSITQGPLFSYAKNAWKMALEDAIKSATRLQRSVSNVVLNKEDLTIHKQLVNRLLEPFQYHTVIVTATEFDNFFKLRCDENAQYEIRRIADLMYEAYYTNLDYYEGRILRGRIISPHSEIQKLKVGEWHCPLVYEEDGALVLDYIQKNYLKYPEYISQVHDSIECSKLLVELTKRISVARCARVSYLTHDGKRDIEKDLELFERLRTSGHWSPFEHVATPYFYSFDEIRGERMNREVMQVYMEKYPINEGYEKFGSYRNIRSGNFIGWKQFRKEFADESCTNFRKKEN